MAVRPPGIARDGRNEDSELGERWLRNGASSWRPQGADDDEADLRRFWKALDEIPGAATDRLDWIGTLGAEWRDIESYLKSTGHRTMAVLCPFPGGDGCPRRDITGANGTIRAVCVSRPRCTICSI